MSRLSTAQRFVDPKVTESYLLTLPGIEDASVWWSDEKLHAHVTVHDSSGLRRRTIQQRCMETLGLHQTPRELLVIQSRLKAA